MTILDYLKQNIQKTEFSQFTIIDEITHQNFSFIFFFGDGDGDNSDGYFDFLNLILIYLQNLISIQHFHHTYFFHSLILKLDNHILVHILNL